MSMQTFDNINQYEGAHVFMCGSEDGRVLQVSITDTHVILDAFDADQNHVKTVEQTFAQWLDEVVPSPNPQIIEPVNDFL